MTAALAFAQALLCPAGGCGTCRTCALAAARQHPDLHVISPTPPESNPKGPRADPHRRDPGRWNARRR